MANEIDKYKKYLTQAQVDSLVQRQRDYNNAHADERVDMTQSVRTRIDQGRRMLQNRGLASAPGRIVSGEEPRLSARVQTPYSGLNEQLRQRESALLENAAVTEANKTIAARNAAAQAAAQEAAERAAQEAAARKAAEEAAQKQKAAKAFGTGAAKSALMNFAAAKYNTANVPPALQAKAQTPGTAKTNDAVTARMIGLAGTKAQRTMPQLQTQAQKAATEAATKTGTIMPKQTGTTSPLLQFGQQKRAEEAEKLQTVEGQKEQYYKNAGYAGYEDTIKSAQTDLAAAKADLNRMTQQMHLLEKTGRVTSLGGQRTVQIPEYAQPKYTQLQTDIIKRQNYIDRLEHKIEINRDAMERINQQWNAQEAFLRYGNLSDEELEQQIKEAETDTQTQAMRRMGDIFDQNNAIEEGRTSSGSGSYSKEADEALQKRQADLRAVQNYRTQMKNAEIVDAGLQFAAGKTATPTKAYNGTVPDTSDQRGILAFTQDMEHNYSLNSERDTGSKYYKAVNDRDAIAAYQMTAYDSTDLLEGNIPKKGELDTMHYFEYALQMTDEEINAFNALYEDQGAAAADKFFEALLPTLDQRGANAINDRAREYAKQNGFLADLVSIPANLAFGFAGPVQNVSDAIRGYDVGKMSAYRNDMAGLIREHRQEGMSDTGRFWYGTLSSMGDSTVAALLSKAVPGLGGAALGGSAYNSAYREALDRGLDEQHAQLTAISSGALEMLFEEVSIEHLINMKSPGSMKQALVNVLVQGGVEASEEVNTEIANMIADKIINGDKAKLAEQYQQLRNRGYSQGQAGARVIMDAAGDVGMAGLGGLVSGGFMGGGAMVIGATANEVKRHYANNYSDAAVLGKNIRANGWDRLVENYTFQDPDAAALKARGEWSNAELGTLFAVMRAEQESGAIGKTIRETDGGVEALKAFAFDDADTQDLAKQKNLTDAEISELYVKMQQQQFDQIRQQLGTQGKETLSTFERIQYGENITETQAQQIAGNKAALRTFNAQYQANASTAAEVLSAANTAAEANRSTFGTPVNENTINRLQAARDSKPSRSYAPALAAETEQTISSTMSDEQRRRAALPSEKDKRGTVKTNRGSVTYEYNEANSRHLTDRQKAAVSFAQAMANATGANIRLVDSMEANGMYDKGTNTLTVALDSDRGVMHTASHELTHWLRENSPEGYAEFAKVLEDEINKIDLADMDGIPEDLRAWIEENNHGEPLFDTFVKYEQQKDSSLSEDDAREEAVAECAEPMLSRMDVQTRLANESLPTAKKVAKFLKDIYKSIQALLEGKDPSSREARLMESGMVDIKAVADAWADAIAKASKSQQTEQQTGVKKQARLPKNFMTDEQIRQNRSEVMQMKPVVSLEGTEFPKSEISLIDQVEAYFKSVGNKATNPIIGDVTLDRKGIGDDLGHKIGRTKAIAFKAIPDVIGQGKIVDVQYDWKDRKYDTVVLSAPITIREDMGVMAVVVKKSSTDDALYLHEVAMIDKKGSVLFKTSRVDIDAYTGNTESSMFNILLDIIKSKPKNQKRDTEYRKKVNEIAETIYPKQQEIISLRQKVHGIEQSKDYNDVMNGFPSPSDPGWDQALQNYVRFMDESGYNDAKRRIEQLDKEIREANKLIEKLQQDKEFQEREKAIVESGLSEADYSRKQAVKEFGYTTNFAEAGYLLPNGKMLNFSGEKGVHRGHRGQDHRAIGTIYIEEKGGEAMRKFMRDGNIRIMGETPGLDILSTVEPTREQYAKIRAFAAESAGKRFFNVDLTDEDGQSIGALVYDGRVNPDRVINDIKHFYATGEIRGQSETDRFRYQKRDIPAPVFDEQSAASDEQRARLGAEELDEAITRSGYKAPFTRLVERVKANHKEWIAKTSLQDGRTISESDTKKLAKTLLRQAVSFEQASVYEDVKSSMTIKDLAERIAKVAPKIWDALHGNTEDSSNAVADMQKLVRDVIGTVTGKNTQRAEDLDLLKEHLPTEIYLNEAQQAEVKSGYGSVYAYAKKLKAALGDQSIVVRNATEANRANLDADWAAITERVASEYADVSDADQPGALLDIAQSLQTKTEKVFRSNAEIEAAAEQLAEQLMTGVIDLVPVQQNVSTEEAQREVMTELASRAQHYMEQAQRMSERYERLSRDYSDAMRDNRSDSKRYKEQLDALKGEIEKNDKLIKSLQQQIRKLENRQVKDMSRELKGMRKRMQRQIDKAQQANEKALGVTISTTRKAMQEQREGLESKHAAEMGRMRKALSEETARGMAAAREALSEQRRKMARESIEKERKALRLGKAETKEAYAVKALKGSITKNLDRLGNIANHPTLGQHIPEELMQQAKAYMMALSNFALDPDKKMDAKVIVKMEQALDNLKYDAESGIVGEQNEEIKASLQELEKIINKRTFASLTSEELATIKKTLDAVTHAISTANQLIGRDVKIGIYEEAQTLVQQMRESHQPLKGGLLARWGYRVLSAERFARLASNYREDSVLVREMQELNKGAIAKERIAMGGNKLFADFIREYGKEYETWQGKNAKWFDSGLKGLFDEKPVYITPAMKLSLIMHARNSQNMKHIIKGGITVPDMELYKKGKIQDAYDRGQRVIISAGDILNLESTLTEAEKAYIKCAEELFYRYAPGEINKASLQLYGYRKAQVVNYFPIRTDKNFNKTNFESIVQNAGIENMGMLKERVNASNPVILEDISQAVRRQIDNTALFAGLAIPIRNFNRVFNTTLTGFEDSVKSAMSAQLGEQGMKIVENIMRDLQKPPRADDYGGFLRKIQSKYVQATLAVNLSVTMKQAASYPTAAAVVGWKPLLKALAKGGRDGRVISRADMELIDRYTPLLYIRQQGMIDRDIADVKMSKDWAEKMPALMDWIRKVDVATVGRLWYAAEYYIQDTKPDLQKGSDAYYRATADVFNRIVQETQPNYSVLQRPDVLRTESDLMRSITMFKTQSFQNGGIIIDAIGEFKATRSLEQNDPRRAAANRKLAHMISSQIIQNVVLTGMTLAANAITQKMNPWRDDDDEVTAESIATNFGLSMASNAAGSFWLGSEIFDAIMAGLNKLTGKEIYAVYEKSSPAVDVYNDLNAALQGLTKAVNLMTDGEKNGWSDYKAALNKVAVGVSEVTGVPYKNIMKLLNGGVTWAQDFATASKTGEMDWFRHGSKSMESEKTAAKYKEWTNAGNSGKTFFYYKRLLKEAPDTEARRDLLQTASDLTADQKATLDKMLLYTGDKEMQVKDGALLRKDADDEWVTVANYASEAMYRLTAELTDKQYQGAEQMIIDGIKPEKALEIWREFKGLEGTGEEKKETFRKWLFEQKDLTAAQKNSVDGYVLGNKTIPDYSSEYAFGISSYSESQQKKAAAAKKAGVPDDTVLKAAEEYARISKAKAARAEDDGMTGANEFRSWLYKQKGMSTAQREALDKAFNGAKVTPDYTDRNWLDVYMLDGSAEKTTYAAAHAAYDQTGLKPATFQKFYLKWKTLDAKDENGNTKSGLKKQRTVELLKSLDLTPDQYNYLYKEICKYK